METLVHRVNATYNAVLTEVSMRSGLNLNRPTYICAKMTMRCNSRCTHCDIWKSEVTEKELSTSQWLMALNDLRRWLGRFSMVFTGGEALLRDDMIGILDHAVRLGIHAELLTNGLLVDDELAKKIVSTGIAQVTLSYDGINPGTHDRFRGERGFHQRTSSAIASLREYSDKLGKPLRILLKTVISRNNLEELVHIALFAQAHGLYVQYQPIEQNYGEEPDSQWFRNSALWIEDIASLKAIIGELKTFKAAGAPIVNSPEELDTFRDYFEHPESLMASIQAHDTTTAAQYCRHAVGNFVISSNGDVRMCFKMEPVGNLASRLPEEIWAGRPRCWARHCPHR